MAHTRRVLPLVIVALVAFAGCADQTFRQTQNFDRPHDVALSCWTAGGALTPIPLFACDAARHRLFGFVTNTEEGGVAVLDIIERDNIDVPFGSFKAAAVPGYTRAQVGSMPAVIVPDAVGRYVYTVNRGSGDLSRLDTTPSGAYAVVHQALPYRPYDAVVGPLPGATLPELSSVPVAGDDGPDGLAKRIVAWETDISAAYSAAPWALYVSAPAESAVLIIPLDEAGWGTLGGADMQVITLTGGAPTRLALTSDGATLFATHLDRGYVSAFDLATGAEERIFVAPACSNGVDDDGDGLVDSADPGCEDAEDDDERDPEWGDRCDDGVDDDGDGLTDGDDPGCDPDDPAIYRCANGTDDDGDGLVDMDDPGCASPRDDSELSDQIECHTDPLHEGCTPREELPSVSELLAIAQACGNGLDDDGDGLTDGTDEGECPGLLGVQTACWNALDDDGDGLTDTDDADECPTEYATGEANPPCSDGRDNDGDGLVDYPDDPGCYSRTDERELDPAPLVLDTIAVSPDDTFLYVGDTAGWSVHVIDWPAGTLVDVLDGPGWQNGRPVLKRLGRRGLPIGAAPRDIVFVSHEDGGIEAFVSAANGTTTVIEAIYPTLRCWDETDARFESRRLHRLKADSRFGTSTAGQPVLLRGDEEIDLAFTVIPEFPTLGPFNIDTFERTHEDACGNVDPSTCCTNGEDDDGDGFVDCLDPDCAAADDCLCTPEEAGEDGRALVNPYTDLQPAELRRYYGVEFGSQPRLQTSETWTLRHEGVIPGTDRTGRFVDDTGTFHDPGVDWCALGVEVGDLLEVRAREGCYRCDDFLGETFEWRIAEVRADTLVVEGPGVGRALRSDTPGTQPVCIRASREEVELPTFDEFTAAPQVAVASALPLPTLDCFGGPVDYAIRVRNEWIVIGSASGYLHHWRNEGGRCVLRDEDDARYAGRATEATLATNENGTPATLAQCPPDAEGFATKFAPATFENFSFRVTLYPGCRTNQDGSVTVLTGETERDLAWRFGVASGFRARQIVTGQLPGRARSVSRPSLRRVYIVDSSGEAVFELNAEFDAEAVNYTFF